MKFFPDFERFDTSFKTGQPTLVWTRLIADLETPVSVMLKLKERYSFLFESVEGGVMLGRFSVIGIKPDLIWRCQNGQAAINRQACTSETFQPVDEAPLESLRNLIDECACDFPAEFPPMTAGLFGYLGYDMVRHMENLPDQNPDTLGIPDSIFLRPTVIAVFDNVERHVTLGTPVWSSDSGSKSSYQVACDRLADVAARIETPLAREKPLVSALKSTEPESNTTKEDYFDRVERARAYIRDGDIYQVVPSQRFSVPFDLPAFSFYRTLRRLNPSPFLFYLDFGDFSVVGSSPEILVRVRDHKVTIRPIAGTRKRGSTPKEDQNLAQDLLADPKELAEHLMLLDLGRHDVGRVAESGSVQVTEQMGIEYYSHVMHIVSNVEGTLRADCNALDALIAGFPAGTVTGAPKIRAMQIIDELEHNKRNLYGGAIGYFGASGDMDTCIALRTAVVKDNTVYIQAGGGVVADSDPEFEYQETCNKAQALIQAVKETLAPENQ